MTSPGSLENRLALVTGAAGPTGAAIAHALADAGAKVILADMNADRLDELCAARADAFTPLVVDVSDPETVQAAWEHMREHHGPVSVLVNNAGILSNNKSEATQPDEWRKVLAVNLDGPFYLSRLCLPDMKAAGWGRIINMCSLAMKTGGLTAGTAYTASKGALGALTFSLARESAPHGITVNGIAPAYIKTPMVTEQLTEAQRQELLKAIPVGRFCEPEEVGYLVAYLASPMAGFITGEIVDINGGLHLD